MSTWKSVRRSIHVLMVLGLLAFCVLPASAQDHQAPSDAYQFPVLPGTEAWKALETHEEMLRATHINEMVLAKMSTRGIVETVLRYPLLGDVLAFNNPQRGFDVVRSRFNGLDELFSRPEAGEFLVELYRGVDPSAIAPNLSLVKQGQQARKVFYIEMLLAQDEILAGMNDTVLSDLLFETMVKREQKIERFDVYGVEGLEPTAWVAARTLKHTDHEFAKSTDKELMDFLAHGDLYSIATLEKVFGRAEELLLDEATSPSVSWLDAIPTKDYPSTVTTPNGSSVPVIVMTWELSSSSIAAAHTWVATHYPLAVREANASRRYNCHSYAWYTQWTSNIRWMNTPGDDKYWQDGSYILGSSTPGAKVSYVNDDHSAIVVSANEFRSKWGQYPLMRHAPNYDPYNGSTLAYYVRPLKVTMSGPTSRQPNQSGTWTCSATAGVPPYTYTWFKTYSGGITNLGGGSSKTTSHSTTFNIVCDVTDSNSGFATDYTNVNVSGGGGPLPF